MSSILISSISILGFSSTRYANQILRKKSTNFYSCCSPSSHSQTSEDEQSNHGNQTSSPLILVERYSNGDSKRYVLDENSSMQTLLEQHNTVNDNLDRSDSAANLKWLPDSIKDFILPAGFPESVSDDYLEYMLWQFPTNVTGWICNALAVGVGSFSGSTAAASAAAIRWVSKDGIGAVGRLIIGGRFGNLFDDDPKQWRMYADFIGSAGRGLKDPSFRVIQNHFAMSGNLGDVSAKEEVWEVTAQLLGLALGILILDTPGLVSSSYAALLSTWMSMRLLHLWFRYQSLSVLQFKTINLKRARMLAKAHVLHSIALGITSWHCIVVMIALKKKKQINTNHFAYLIPGCFDCNREENILSLHRFLKPRIIFGVPFSELIAVERSSTMMKIFELYSKKKYILIVDQWEKRDFEVLVCFKAGATSESVLQSVWQTYWLYEHWDNTIQVIKALEEGLLNLDRRFNSFMDSLEEAGWNTQKLNLKVPKEPYIEFDDKSNNSLW
ncbi:Protein root UVB sensitive 5 [Bienertia sinuspersici]